MATSIMLQFANELLQSDIVSKAMAMLGVGWLITSYTFVTMLLTDSTDAFNQILLHQTFHQIQNAQQLSPWAWTEWAQRRWLSYR